MLVLSEAQNAKEKPVSKVTLQWVEEKDVPKELLEAFKLNAKLIDEGKGVSVRLDPPTQIEV